MSPRSRHNVEGRKHCFFWNNCQKIYDTVSLLPNYDPSLSTRLIVAGSVCAVCGVKMCKDKGEFIVWCMQLVKDKNQ